MTKRNAPLAVADANGHVWTRALPLSDTQALLDGIKKHHDGYLIADARVARIGLQTYLGSEVGMPDKERVTLYRPPEEVFATDSMRSHANKPVTLTHPKNMVDAKTWAKVAKGFSGSDVVRDGEYVRVPLMLTDAAAIKAFEDGEARELSVGYTTDIDWTPGSTPDGKAYDGIQRYIRTNHHALVPVARGGANLRLGDAGRYCQDCGTAVMDGATTCKDCGAKLRDDDDQMLPDGGQTNAADSGNIRSDKMAIQKVIDSVPVQFVDEQSAAVVMRELSRLQTVADAAEAKAKKLADDMESDDDEDDKKKKANDAAIAAKDGEIAMLKKQLSDATLTDAQIDERIAERARVLDAAKTHLPAGFDPAGKSIADIHRVTVSASLGDAAVKDWDAARFAGAFSALTVKPASGGARAMADGMSNAMRDLGSNRSGASLADAEAAAAKSHADYVERLRNAHKAVVRN